jgi:tRNA-uridine 2-sulfurtransferase
MADQYKTVAVAMSGGSDSAAVAVGLCAQGYKVFGLTAVLTAGYSRCCAPDDVQAAHCLCDALGIPHHIIELEAPFRRQVVDPFVEEYLSGRTPSPCLLCNRYIKFGKLLDEAVARGADRMATGHYARLTEDGSGTFRLRRGVDETKDQSYFLAMLGQAELKRALFPLGGRRKTEVVAELKRSGFQTVERPESQEVCFVTEGDTGDWIEVRSFSAPGKGDIVDKNGRKLGEHPGIHHYTVGQRKGLGVAARTPLYVTRLDAARNLVVLGEREEAMSSRMIVKKVNWTTGEPAGREWRLLTQIRYRHEAAEAVVRKISDDSLEVEFLKPQFAITPGQASVFYREDEILGGGWIERSC